MMGFVWGFYLRRIAFGNTMCGQMVSPNGTVIEEDRFGIVMKKSESLQTEGRHFRSMICKINDV